MTLTLDSFFNLVSISVNYSPPYFLSSQSMCAIYAMCAGSLAKQFLIFFTFTPSPPFPNHSVCRQFSKTIQSNHPVKAFTQMDVMRRESRLLHDDDESDVGDDDDDVVDDDDDADVGDDDEGDGGDDSDNADDGDNGGVVWWGWCGS